MTTMAGSPPTVAAEPLPPQPSSTVRVTGYRPADLKLYVALTTPVDSLRSPGCEILPKVHWAVWEPPGLSVKIPVKVTFVIAAKMEPLAGPVIVTAGLGFVTVTCCVQEAELFAVSLAVQVITVVPNAYGAFNGWLSLRNPDTVVGPQLSVAVASPGFTLAEHWPGILPGVVMFAGQLMTGGVLSTTVITCVALAVLPPASVAV